MLWSLYSSTKLRKEGSSKSLVPRFSYGKQKKVCLNNKNWYEISYIFNAPVNIVQMFFVGINKLWA